MITLFCNLQLQEDSNHKFNIRIRDEDGDKIKKVFFLID